MTDGERYQILALLKTEFPGFNMRLDRIYWLDPVFRQIAGEYYECISKQKVEISTSNNQHDFYADTIRELRDELMEHLQK